MKVGFILRYFEEWKFSNSESGNFISIAGVKNGKYHGSLLHYTENFSLPLQYSFKLPGFIQDTVSFRLGSNRPEFLKLSSNDYKMKIKGEMDKKERFLSVMAQNGCKCVKKNCACCAYIPLPEHEALNICVNATYNSETVGLDLAIGVNGHYFTQEISLRNPPPICLGIPELEHIAGVCIAFTDVRSVYADF
ncbi:hypothetical protein WR25_08417 isoform B [Diploscapter pachys]|uniref:DUF4773 domain-containing protein n=1 Tax=Diploscapter pachys TaxID=2018661 RepID=A0A2A2KTY3_9BILA|nr:hypothetical protein WR25_08417 isoform B [Diploscapter pachys]